MENKVICHDCQRELAENEEFLSYKTEVGEFIKCKSCHQKDSTLRNFRPTEVYSRVCGYIRPIDQWNKGKQEEFKDRVEFNPKKEALAS